VLIREIQAQAGSASWRRTSGSWSRRRPQSRWFAACRHHLRRQQRGAAQYSRPGAAPAARL